MSGIQSVADLLAVVLILLGAVLCLTAGLGLLRFPDVLTRMHAGTKPQVLGVLLIMVGAGIRLQGWSATWMLLLVAAFQMLTAPVSAHMISRVAYRRRHVRRDRLLVDELRTAESRDSIYRGDEPADSPPDRPGDSLARSRQEDRELRPWPGSPDGPEAPDGKRPPDGRVQPS